MAGARAFPDGRAGRVLLSNDDGIDAPGLEVLEALAREVADEVWVVAPAYDCSGYGRSLTLTRDIKGLKLGERRYTCDGTPTDCIIFALNHLMIDCPPDLMLSGVNMGMNISDDITCSGTVGAAWEATVAHIPAIALSQMRHPENSIETPDDFDCARQHGPGLVKKLMRRGWPEHILMNINFPGIAADDIAGVRAVGVARHKVSDEVIPGSEEHTYRIGKQRQKTDLDPGSDLGALLEGYVTVCPLSIDMADYTLVEELEKMKL